MLDLSVIIVVTNDDPKLLEDCLNSIYSHKKKVFFEVILIDNKSKDNNAETAKIKFPQIKLIKNDKRESFPINNNKGIKAGQGRYFLLLNADTVVQPDTFEAMVEFMDTHPKAGVSACKIFYPSGDLQLSCRRFPSPLSSLLNWPIIGGKLCKLKFFDNILNKYLMKDYNHIDIVEVDWVIAAFFMIRHKTIEEIGLLDEKFMFPMYIEDIEFCFRVKQSGWKTYYVPTTSIIHNHQRSSAKGLLSKMTLAHINNLIYFYRKKYAREKCNYLWKR